MLSSPRSWGAVSMEQSWHTPEWASAEGKLIKSAVESQNQLARTRLENGWDGLSVASGLADERVQALRTHFLKVEELSGIQQHQRLSFVVTGGLGRNEISPYSDLDLVLICDDPSTQEMRDFANAFFYPLWDAGLDIGHAIRKPTDFYDLVAEDLTVLTASLDWRPVAGSGLLLREFNDDLNSLLGSDEMKSKMREHMETWAEGVNLSTAHRLEPNLKTGTGKLRTLHETWWAARYLWRIGAWRDLYRRGIVERFEVDTLNYGHRVILEARLALQFCAGRRVDVLQTQYQTAVAESVGVIGTDTEPAADLLLKTIYRCAKAIRAAADRMLDVSLESMDSSPGRAARTLAEVQEETTRVTGKLAFSNAAKINLEASSILNLLRQTQILDCGLHWSARAIIQEAVPRLFTPEACRLPANIDVFMDLITHTGPRGDDLERLHAFGILERMFTDFKRVTGLVQRDLYHVYTVDAHLIATARRALMVLAGDSPEDPPDLVATAARVVRQHVLVVAALFHDIGKGQGHGHSERGAKLARVAAENLGWSEDDVEDLVFLVEQHLAMMIISQRRDMEDPDLIARFAKQVETQERLDMLVVLTYVDAVSTGPEAFTGWKAALLRELYIRTRHALRAGAGEPGVNERRLARIQELCQTSTPGDGFREFLKRMSGKHVLSHGRNLLREHQMTLEQAELDGAAVRIHGNRKRNRWEIIISCLDRTGLAADSAYILSVLGLQIIGAHMSVTHDGYSLDTFIIRSSQWSQLEDKRFQSKVIDEVTHAVQSADVRDRSAAAGKSRWYKKPTRQPRVIFDPEASDRQTVLDVLAEDRTGLIYDISQAIFECGASIESARITTEGRRAIHAFYVIDKKTMAPLDEAARNKVGALILERLS